MKDIPVIKCPICGAEYMPSEVFIPESFFGKQTEVIRNPDGTMNFYIGDDMDLVEEFICETCSSKLKINANLSFNVTCVDDTFDEEYEEAINKVKLDEVDIFND